MAGTASAQTDQSILDGVNIRQLGEVVSAVKKKHGLEVEERRTKAGTPYLFLAVPNTDLAFIATGVGCRGLGGRCDGFMYVMGDPEYEASPALVLSFNNSAFFAKLVPLPDVTVLRMEVLVDGGVSPKLIDNSLLTFAARINDYRTLKGPAEPDTEDEGLAPSPVSGFSQSIAAAKAPGGWSMPVRRSMGNWQADDTLIDELAGR